MLSDTFHASLEPMSLAFWRGGGSFSDLNDFGWTQGKFAGVPVHVDGGFNALPMGGASQSFDFTHTLSPGGMIAPAPTLHVSPLPMHAEPVALVSPPQSAEVSFLNGIDSDDNVVATSFWTWTGANPPTYAGQSDASKWGTNHATDDEVETINYYFQPSANWNATEKGVWESCLAMWSAVTNVEFNLVTVAGDADLTLKRGTDGSAYEFDTVTGGAGTGTIGQSKLWTKVDATISVDTSVPGFGPLDGSYTAFGGYVWETLLHELGHALGLGHGGPYNGNVNPVTQQYSAYDVRLWTIMSYIRPDETAKYSLEYPVNADWGTSPDGYHNTATTWMPLDILAVQGLYGTPLTTPLSGDQTFGFNTNITGAIKNFFDFTVNVNPVITIYSTGTNNTLDLSGFTADATVDLHPGTYSSCDGLTNNLAIAYDTVVETAIGGKGNDSLTGTDLVNTLVGNKGSDALTGGLAGDSLTGGKGADVLGYGGVADSTSADFDSVAGFDFSAGADTFELPVTVDGIDAKVKHGDLSLATFDGDLENAVGAGELAEGHAVIFKPNGGDFDGSLFLIVEAGGGAGYQAGEDFVFQLVGGRHISDLDVGNFAT